MLLKRTIQLAFEGQVQEPSPLDIGLPQGSPVSPILFLIYVARVLAKRGFQLSYIDDFSITVSSTSAKKNCQVLNDVLQDLFQLAEEKGVEFDIAKTELIHFHTHREEIEEPIMAGQNMVKPSAVVKWLGISLDRRLNFKTHVEGKVTAAQRAFFGMSKLGNTQRGLSFRALRQLYIACVTSIADYGVQLWWSKSTTQHTIRLFQQLQNRASRRLLGAFRGSPTKALELEAALLPPRIRFERACVNYSLRVKQLEQSHPIYQAAVCQVAEPGGGESQAKNTQLERLVN